MSNLKYTQSKSELYWTKFAYLPINMQILNYSHLGKIKLQELLEKDVFKVVTIEKILNNTQIFKSCFVDYIKYLCTDKVDE